VSRPSRPTKPGKVVVLDYGSGNLRSAQRALERVGAQVTVTDDARQAVEADGLVVPGVGAFAACMAGLARVGGADILRRRLADDRPVLGICVGMQVLFDAGVEHGVESAGLGVLPGRVEPLHAPVLPHMGWNTVDIPAGSDLFAGIEAGTRFYFVHSYAVHATKGHATKGHATKGHATKGHATKGLVTTAQHGEVFVAAVECGVVSATQFHPEKSGDAGATVLANWVGSL
jgi:imidazole glycerol-phosphate synthase subunit HisH